MNWSLKELYSSFESKEFLDDLNKAKKMIEEIETFSKEFCNLKSVEVLERYIKHFGEYRTVISKLITFSSLSFSVNTSDTSALKYAEKIKKMNSDITGPMVEFSYYLKNIGENKLKEIINSSKVLEEFEYHILEIFNGSLHLLSKEEEVLISKLKQTGSASFATLQSQLSSSLLVEIDGEKLPLQAARNLAYDKDPLVRKNAYYAELKAYKVNEVASAACLNAIKGEVITLSKERGYESPLYETLFNARMKKETLDALISSIEEFLPKLREYYKLKAKKLGHENGLPFYDLFAPMGGSKGKISIEEAKSIVVDNFSSFSNELGDFARNAFEKNWIDILPKKGKVGGAFCSNIKAINESRILVNFTGSLNNAVTLAHELGHGFHGQNIFEENILNTSYPMPLAETASIFCETIVKKSALEKAGKDEKLTILEASLQGYGQVIVDIYSRFIFETNLFETRRDHALSVDELKKYMLDAQKKAYGDALNHESLHPYMWMNKPHYYYSERNFYNFPYAFGLLFSKGLYSLYLSDKDEFVKNYNIMLKNTGKLDIESVAKLMNIDVTSKEFWSSSLKEIEKEIDEFSKIVN
ncbi:M3 family oligoendopeptidase [Helicovermis profundi]|uniref:M3 family oligoendopeptidase n=1 Tax=Helicovermis profundi TaxID=3065157 RepID=A0AAU9E544_9FIRM|nr:M3 family oligoendopeptidase [Clostridia bacterium S502]